MECGVIKDDDGSWSEHGQQLRGQPFVENFCVACAAESHRRDQFFGAVTADQTRARTFIAGDIAVNFLPDERPSMRAARCRRKARFINKDSIESLLRGFVETL